MQRNRNTHIYICIIMIIIDLYRSIEIKIFVTIIIVYTCLSKKNASITFKKKIRYLHNIYILCDDENGKVQMHVQKKKKFTDWTTKNWKNFKEKQ